RPEGFLDLDRVPRGEREREHAGELVVHVGRERELRLAEREAALARSHVIGCEEAREPVLLRVQGEIAVAAGEDRGDRRVEGGEAGRWRAARRWWCDGGRRRCRDGRRGRGRNGRR